MIYATTPARRGTRVRRFGLGRAHSFPLGDNGDGFSWSDFGTSIAQSAAQGAAGSAVQLLKSSIAPKPVIATAPAPVPASLGSVPTWAWMAGGFGLLLVLVIVMKR